MKEVVLKVENINKYYKNFHAIKDVSFEVYKGEIVGFIGPNGAGKSTVMKCINTLLTLDSGNISVCGNDIKKERNKALANQASLVEAPGLYLDISGRDNLKLFANLRKVDDKRIREVEKIININEFITKKVSQYSLGMKQRLALGIVLLSKPKFIILDEPTNGLDPTGVIDLRNLLLKLKADGTSILFSSHQLGEIEKIADRIISIKDGEIIPFSRELTKHKNYKIRLLEDLDILKTQFENIKDILSYEFNSNTLSFITTKEITLNNVLKLINDLDLTILDITNQLISVEDLYLEIFGD